MSIALFFDTNNEALIITGIKIASFTYGILLVLFILAKLKKKFSMFSIYLGMFLGIVSVLFASYYGIAWTLFILISF